MAQGGSTITQQLAKNLFLTQERTITRKLQEVLLALWLERKFSKTQILELYLNRVYFGAGAYGIEQASLRYFGKSAQPSSLAEAAMLAGLVKSPSRLAPTRNFNAAEKRAKIVLAAMAELHFISPTQEKVAIARPPRIVAQRGNGAVNYVADWVMDALNDVLGHVDEDVVGQDLDRRHPAGRRGKIASPTYSRPRAPKRRDARRAGGDDAGRRGARLDRRPQLRRQPVQPRGRRQTPTRLGVQTVRLSDRARTRPDAGHACASTGRSRSKAGSRKITATNISAR